MYTYSYLNLHIFCFLTVYKNDKYYNTYMGLSMDDCFNKFQNSIS